MQARHRSPGDGIRSGSLGHSLSSGRISPDGPIRRHGIYNSNSNYRNFNRGGFNRGHPKPYIRPQPPCKADIFMEAGRLAAEYLVSKGLLPPSSLPGKWPDSNFQEFKRQERGNPMPPPLPEGRTSALARLGSTVQDVGHGRRRSSDEFNYSGSRNHTRGRKRMGHYNKGYGSDWGRDDRRNGRWMDEEGEDDISPEYQRNRRGGFDEVGSSISRASTDDQSPNSEMIGDSKSELENYELPNDAGSKASSSCTRKDPGPEADVELNNVLDGVRIPNSEIGEVFGEVEIAPSCGDLEKNKTSEEDLVRIPNSEIGEVFGEVKIAASCGDLENNKTSEEDLAMQPCAVEGDPVSKHGNDLLTLCSFVKVPTRPRSSFAHKSPKVDEIPSTEASNAMEIAPSGTSELIAGDYPIKGSLSDSLTNQTNSLECQTLTVCSILPVQSMEESVDPKHESSQSPPGFGISKTAADVEEEDTLAHDEKKEGTKRRRDSSMSRVSHENEYSCMHNLIDKQSSPYVERLSPGEEMTEAIHQEKPVDAALFPKVEAELTNIKSEEERKLLPTSFKICDLNFVENPEITEIPDDPILDHIPASVPTLETEEDHSVDFGLSIGNTIKNTNDYSRLSGDDKVVPVIDLEDDSPLEHNACEPSKPKSEMIYPSLDNFLDNTKHADVLPSIQDGYNLAISEFLGTDISDCSSVQADLGNMQTGMSLHGAEVVPGVDDSIYVSLEEIPNSGYLDAAFMDWDPPPQEFGKFF